MADSGDYRFAGRPLKIIHSFGFSRGDCREKREQIIDGALDRIYRMGYGGIVTNVDTDLYLESAENWESLRYVVRRAAGIGFRVWLYDEHGYPSGGAGGITLRDNPEYEALALCEVTENGKPGERVVIGLPRGHMHFVRTGNEVEFTSGRVVVAADESGTGRAFAVKRVYEGTHAEHNVHESRRYVNVLNEEAVRAFIRNTYEAYVRELGPLFKYVEAIFTDEPSIMAAYINAGLYPGRVRDEFDDTLPLYPIVVWDGMLPEKYKEKWGEDLMPKLGDLFGPRTDANAVTRYRFFSVTSDMFENAYFRQIADFCVNAGTKFSGHVLLEEEILHHPVFEGNIFRFTGHMGVPGIDMLTTVPENVLRQAPTPKLVSSAAHWNGLTEVMSEVSGHMEGAFRRPFGTKEMMGSVALQRALGVTVFTSYYSDTAVPEDEFIHFSEFTGNIGRFLQGGKTSTHRVLLLYPIEAAQAATSGSGAQLGEREHTEGERRLEESWQRLNRKLLLSGLEYECVDLRGLSGEACAGDGLITDRSGNTYAALVCPYTDFDDPCLMPEIAEKLEKGGVRVFMDADGNEESAAELVSGLASYLASLKTPVLPVIEYSDGESGEPQLIVTSLKDASCYELAYLIVNYTDRPFEGRIALNVPDGVRVTSGDRAVMMDPDDGVFRYAGEANEDRKLYIDAKLRPMGALLAGFRRKE